MKYRNRIFAFFLSMVLVFSCFSTSSVAIAANQDAQDDYGITGTTTGSGTGLTYKSTFTEDWEGGLDLNKWCVEKYDESYISDFQVVHDPLGGDNQVVTFSRFGAWLVADKDYWPSEGLTAGEMTVVSFRLYLKDVYQEVNIINNVHPGIAFSYKSPVEYEGWQFGTHDGRETDRSGLMASKYSWNQSCISTKLSTWNIDQDGQFADGFALDDWFDVTITYSGSKMTFSATDKNDVSFTTASETKSIYGGRFCVGNRMLANVSDFKGLNETPQTNGVVYLDDIQIQFMQSTVDTDDEQMDVNAYFAGNTFLNPGEALNITGEDLGATVANAQIKKIDTMVSTNPNAAEYIDETTYDYAALTETNWEDIPAIDGSLITELPIIQRSVAGIKMILPDGSVSGQEMYAQPGSYAVLLESVADGKDEIVIVNNPQISLLLQDDGDYATPDGWLKLGGYNLSVCDDTDVLRAIIIDEVGNRIMVDNKRIEADTTDNNGVDNDYYMMIHLDGLKAGNYQVMVHNGFGGDYGWSRPYAFTVKEKAENEIWRAKGTFDVTDYGAVGDSRTNDTAAIMRAIDAAVENGGGKVYFPALPNGKAAGYRITQPLIVGENISLVGDGMDKSYLFYHGFLDTKEQEYFISYEKNFEICDMQLVCQTNPFEQILKRSTANNREPGKVYIKNVYFLSDYTGVTSGAQGMCMEGYTDATAQVYVNKQWANRKQRFYNGVSTMEETLISFVDSEITLRNVNNDDGYLFAYAKYLYFDQTDLTDGGAQWNHFESSVCGFFENGSVDYLSGKTLYRNINNSDRTHNNRELFLCDGGLTKTNVHLQPLIHSYTETEFKTMLESELELLADAKKEDLLESVSAYVTEHQGKAYRFLDYNASDVGNIYVTYGQGAGQLREISNLKKIGNYTYFTIEEPFAVTPNRSSEIAFGTVGMKTFVNHGVFSNGNLVGPYGAFVDLVFDNIDITESTSGVEFIAAYQGMMWYATAKNITADEIAYAHTNTIDTETAGLAIKGVSVGNQFLGIRYCHSSIGEGGYITITASTAPQPIELSDLVYENIRIVSQTPGVLVNTGSFSQGVMLKDIAQYTERNNSYSEISPYDTSSMEVIKSGIQKLVFGTSNIWCNGVEAKGVRARGDINNDGFVSQTDVALLRNVFGARLTQQDVDGTYGKHTYDTYSDVTEDGIINVSDFHYLRAFILKDSATMNAILNMRLALVIDRDEVTLEYGKTTDAD